MKHKPMSSLQIAAKIKARINFTVANNSQRVRVLNAAKLLGIQVVTRACDGGFAVLFLKG